MEPAERGPLETPSTGVTPGVGTVGVRDPVTTGSGDTTHNASEPDSAPESGTGTDESTLRDAVVDGHRVVVAAGPVGTVAGGSGHGRPSSTHPVGGEQTTPAVRPVCSHCSTEPPE